MIKKGILFDLIKSLTKSEKRYFRLFASQGKGQANYLLLFDAFEALGKPDDAAIRKKFRDQAFTKQLHVAKIYLYDLILKALRNYHAGRSAGSRILDLLHNTEILYSKELYEAALQKAEKAASLASRYEKLPLLLEALQWRRRLLLSGTSTAGESMSATLDAGKLTLDKLHDLHGYWRLAENMFGEVQKPSFQEEMRGRRPTTLEAVTLHRHVLYSYYFMRGRLKEAEREISQLIKFLEKEPLRIEDDPGAYVTSVSNKIGLLLGQKRWDEIEPLIKTMRDVPARYKLSSHGRFTVKLWLRIFNLELEVYRDTRQLSKGVALVREMEAFLAGHHNNIPDQYRIMLYYQSASLFFLKGNYARALQWVNAIINTGFEETRNELQCHARILNLLVHFELNNIIVLRYAVDSCRRFLRKKKRLGAFEKQVLGLFSALGQSPSSEYPIVFAEKTNLLEKEFRLELDNLQDYIDLRQWMKSKVR